MSNEEKQKRTPSKVFVVTGEVKMFDSARDAAKFINENGGVFSAIRGRAMTTTAKVSLK